MKTNWTNYHTHTHYCDGKGEAEEFVEMALDEEMSALGFSAHSPVPFKESWNMKYEDLLRYWHEIEGLKKEFAGEIEIFNGLEVDFIEGLTGVSTFKNFHFDYTIGGVHYLRTFENGKFWNVDKNAREFERGVNEIFGGGVERALWAYYDAVRKMVENDPPDIVAHLDLMKKFNKDNRFFDELQGWHREQVFETLESIAQSGCIVEVNTRSFFKRLNDTFSPSPWVLERCLELKIPVTISADAHHPSEVVSFMPEVAGLLTEIGFQTVRILCGGGWRDVEFSPEGLKI